MPPPVADPGPRRVLVVEHEPHAGPGRLVEGLQSHGIELHRRRPDLGDPLPDTVSGLDGLIVLGGSMAAWEDELAPWLPRTRALLAEAAGSGVPTLAICLGAQLLAMATGGAVERGDAGLEVGPVQITSTDAAASDPLLGAVTEHLGQRFAVPHWHQDAITELPPDAVLLATADPYPHQAFRVGQVAWGLQYHPEVTAEDWADWMAGGHGAVRTEGLHPERIDAAMRDVEPHLRVLAAAHARAFAATVASARAGLAPSRDT